jgi:hypothetical protein
MDQFIGNKEILGVVILDKKTPGGNEMVEVSFADSTKEQMPKLRFETIVTDEKSDDTSVLNKLKTKVGSMLFGMLHEYGAKWGEVDPITDAMIEYVNNGFAKANNIKWGFDKMEIPLITINDVLVENGKQDNNGAAS